MDTNRYGKRLNRILILEEGRSLPRMREDGNLKGKKKGYDKGI